MSTVSVRNPYTGQTDYTFTEPSPADVAATAVRLRKNQPAWQALGLTGRLTVFEDFAQCLRRHEADLIEALIADTGRTHVARSEVAALFGFIDRARLKAPAALAPAAPREAQVPGIEGAGNRVPYGLVGNISPWNFPLVLSFLDTLPALAAGNAVLLKPSEITPRWVVPFQAALAECPQLAAVLEVIVGAGAVGAAVVEQVDAVVFTGSVETGHKVARAAAQRFIPAYLELGGKDPALVLPGANIEAAARILTFCSVQSAGQACQSIERVYVAREHYDEFVAAAIKTAEAIAINYPDIDAGPVGPFIMADQAAKVLQQVADAKGAGAEVHTGGELLNNGGLWIRPTVMTNVDHSMAVMTEETFGPVMPIMAFASVDEAIELANDSRYGLSAAVFAATTEEAQAVAPRLHAGAVSINDAALTAVINEFEHDAFGESGIGVSRAGLSAYRRFTREQSVMTNTTGNSVLASLYA